MMGYRSHLGFMLSIIFQIVGLLMIIFFGLSISSIAVFMFGALIGLIAAAETKNVFRGHLYAMASTILGLVIVALMAVVAQFYSVIILLVLNDAVCFAVLGASDYRKRNVPRKLPPTAQDKIKIGEEADRIFKELEEEVKKAKKKEVKVKTVSKKTASKKTKQKFSGVDNGKTFHLPTCSILLRQDSKSYVHFGTRQQALAKGRRPCRVCNP